MEVILFEGGPGGTVVTLKSGHSESGDSKHHKEHWWKLIERFIHLENR